jgi:hypothetical protein
MTDTATREIKNGNFSIVYNEMLNAIADAGYDPDDVFRFSYSGRSMYGKTCFGLEVEYHHQAVAILAALAFSMGESEGSWQVVDALVQNMSVDNMGLGLIYYFPRWQCDWLTEYEDVD